MLVQRPQGNEALRGIDGYEQMVNTFAKNAKAYWRLWGPRRGDLGGAAMLVPVVATAKLWRGQSSLGLPLAGARLLRRDATAAQLTISPSAQRTSVGQVRVLAGLLVRLFVARPGYAYVALGTGRSQPPTRPTTAPTTPPLSSALGPDEVSCSSQ